MSVDGTKRGARCFRAPSEQLAANRPNNDGSAVIHGLDLLSPRGYLQQTGHDPEIQIQLIDSEQRYTSGPG